MLVDLSAVPDMAGIEAATGWHAGARRRPDAGPARHRRHARRRLPALAEAARAAAGPGHRSVATLGGNLCLDTRCVFYNQSEWWRAANGYCLKRGGDTCHVAPQGERCHAAFSGDLAPALLALGAEVELLSVRGARWLPLAELYRDDGAAHLTLAARRGAAARAHAGARRPAWSAPTARRACAARWTSRWPASRSRWRCVEDGLDQHRCDRHHRHRVAPVRARGPRRADRPPVDAALLAAIGKLVQKQVSPMRSTVTESNYRRLVADHAGPAPGAGTRARRSALTHAITRHQHGDNHGPHHPPRTVFRADLPVGDRRARRGAGGATRPLRHAAARRRRRAHSADGGRLRPRARHRHRGGADAGQDHARDARQLSHRATRSPTSSGRWGWRSTSARWAMWCWWAAAWVLHRCFRNCAHSSKPATARPASSAFATRSACSGPTSWRSGATN